MLCFEGVTSSLRSSDQVTKERYSVNPRRNSWHKFLVLTFCVMYGDIKKVEFACHLSHYICNHLAAININDSFLAKYFISQLKNFSEEEEDLTLASNAENYMMVLANCTVSSLFELITCWCL